MTPHPDGSAAAGHGRSGAPPRVAVIVNPVSGTGGRADIARRRLDLAAATLRRRGLDGQVAATEAPGHARELVRAAIEQGAALVIAWGGDGTVNEVASQLAFGPVALGIIPSGSGNGLARELKIPPDPDAAFAIALDGAERVIDAGELDGRLFFNVAGIGFDAHIAHLFAVNGLVRRGFARYVEIGVRELFTFEPDDHTVVVDGASLRTRALFIALANARQYGNGALVAPHARLDDGRLDVVVVAYRPPIVALLQAPMLFAGRLTDLPGVTALAGTHVEITSARPAIYHVDGEPFVGGAALQARIRPAALRVRVTPLVTETLQHDGRR